MCVVFCWDDNNTPPSLVDNASVSNSCPRNIREFKPRAADLPSHNTYLPLLVHTNYCLHREIANRFPTWNLLSLKREQLLHMAVTRIMRQSDLVKTSPT